MRMLWVNRTATSGFIDLRTALEWSLTTTTLAEDTKGRVRVTGKSKGWGSTAAPQDRADSAVSGLVSGGQRGQRGQVDQADRFMASLAALPGECRLAPRCLFALPLFYDRLLPCCLTASQTCVHAGSPVFTKRT